MTLPERTLNQLAAIHHDRAKAIVKATDTVVGTNTGGLGKVHLVEMLLGKALLAEGHNLSLKKIPWLKMAEIAPGRNILIIPSGTSTDSLEVAILDLLETLPNGLKHERPLLEEIRGIISRLRKSLQISKAEILFFDMGRSNSRLKA